MNHRPKVLFQNDTIIALDKPARLLSVPDRHNADKPSLAGLILHEFPSARPLHRLDFETSGIILFCILPEAFGWYSDQFEQRIISKSYIALTEGRPNDDEGVIDSPLFTQSTGKVIISKRGKPSQTQWKALEKYLHHTMIEANPLTGRTHQIRVHLSSVGLPLIGDQLYGSKGPLLLSSLKGRKNYRLGKDEEEERPLLSRIALHASAISFLDFKGEDRIHVSSDLPKDMEVSVSKLRQYSRIAQ